MKYFTSTLLVILLAVAFLSTGNAADKAANKYEGVKVCAPCHKSATIGKQYDIWHDSKHAQAYKTLTTPAADSIAKAKGSKKAAVETAECLGCHTVTAPVAQLDKTFDVKDGVQCELCHGAGSAYKSMTVMKDKAKAIAAGMSEYKDDAAIEKKCTTCHNDKSPTSKAFNFKEYYGKIKHSVPKKG
ncbi:MAG: multiheme c-type cytochrome [Bacteroidota bacterium]